MDFIKLKKMDDTNFLAYHAETKEPIAVVKKSYKTYSAKWHPHVHQTFGDKVRHFSHIIPGGDSTTSIGNKIESAFHKLEDSGEPKFDLVKQDEPHMIKDPYGGEPKKADAFNLVHRETGDVLAKMHLPQTWVSHETFIRGEGGELKVHELHPDINETHFSKSPGPKSVNIFQVNDIGENLLKSKGKGDASFVGDKVGKLSSKLTTYKTSKAPEEAVSEYINKSSLSTYKNQGFHRTDVSPTMSILHHPNGSNHVIRYDNGIIYHVGTPEQKHDYHSLVLNHVIEHVKIDG